MTIAGAHAHAHTYALTPRGPLSATTLARSRWRASVGWTRAARVMMASSPGE